MAYKTGYSGGYEDLMSPCVPFATEADLCCIGPTGLEFPDPCLNDGTPIPQAIVDNSLMSASELLWYATGRRFGMCEVTVRPCRKDCNPCPDLDFFNVGDFFYGFGLPWWPAKVDGLWLNVPPCCPGRCGCTDLSQVELPSPVRSVEEVFLDGSVFPATGYRVDEFRYLVRIDGGRWPNCQNLEDDLTEEGTFGVTLRFGDRVPALLTQATAALACEFMKACVGAPCQLPQRISTLTRQGVTVGFIDPMEFWSDGLTGIYLVDIAIKTLNPHRLTRKPTVHSPDVGPKWRLADT